MRAPAPTVQRVVWLLLMVLLPARPTHADEIAAGVFVRSDTDGTQVVSPSTHARLAILDDATHIEAGYAADIWTSASIDIRTAATTHVSEQRDQLTLGIDRELTDVTLRADYRFSNENDYTSHGGSLSLVQRFADGNATLGVSAFAAQDTVGRSGDPRFSRGVATLGGRLAFTQVLDPRTLIQGTWQLTRRDGYQSSPYRFVGVGGDGTCAGTAQLCLPETHPGERMRHAFVLRGRRAIGSDASLGLAYRFYVDDWALQSHTGIAQVAWLPDDSSTLLVRYRLYFQTGASFYRARYDDPAASLRFVTRDRELSPMRTNRLTLAYERTFDLTDAGPWLKGTVGLSATRLHYDDFVGLSAIWAVDLVLNAAVEL